MIFGVALNPIALSTLCTIGLLSTSDGTDGSGAGAGSAIATAPPVSQSAAARTKIDDFIAPPQRPVSRQRFLCARRAYA